MGDGREGIISRGELFFYFVSENMYYRKEYFRYWLLGLNGFEILYKLRI